MKINQNHAIIRIAGAVILLMGLFALSLLIIGPLKSPEKLVQLNYYIGIGLSFVFIFAGIACWITDSIVICEDRVYIYETRFLNSIEKVIPREDIEEFALRDAKIYGRRKIRDGKELILRLENGEEILVKDADSEVNQNFLLSKINKVW